MLEHFCQRKPQISKILALDLSLPEIRGPVVKKEDITEVPSAVGIQHSGFVKSTTEAL
jgi:hypothetical protein